MVGGQTPGLSTDELGVLRALDKMGGEGHFQVIKRAVLPYRPKIIEEMMWSLSRAGYLQLNSYSGMVKLTKRGEQALGRIRFRRI